MNEEMLKLITWLNEEKAQAQVMKKIAIENSHEDNENWYQGRSSAFSSCIKKINEICGCDSK
jgi:phosphoribosyl-AMP cyclohydrolase